MAQWKDATNNALTPAANTAHYVYRTINSPVAQTARLSLSNQGRVAVWVNQREVLRAVDADNTSAGQYVFNVSLKQGGNAILLKLAGPQPNLHFNYNLETLAESPVADFGSWYHLGPFKAKDHNAAFSTVYPPESGVDLERTFEGGLQWKEHSDWEDGTAHNDLLSGENSANFLYRIIHSSRPQPVHLSLGSDDGIQVWVNGRKVLNKNVGRNDAKADQEKLIIQLAQGKNELLLKISNGGGKTGYYFKATHGKEPDDVRNILNLASDKRNDGQKKRLLDWYKGYDLGYLALELPVKFHELSQPNPVNVPVFSAKSRQYLSVWRRYLQGLSPETRQC